jgi:hypothetical protein
MFGMRRKDEAPGGRCTVHNFADASARCRSCGIGHCDECLVYPFGRRRQPYCVSCALVAAGARRRSS